MKEDQPIEQSPVTTVQGKLLISSPPSPLLLLLLPLELHCELFGFLPLRQQCRLIPNLSYAIYALNSKELKRKCAHWKSMNKQKPRVVKPMKAYMIFMNMNREQVQKKYGEKRIQSAELNKELGQLWQQMSKEEQKPYYEIANQRKELHQQQHPNWSARENYAIHKKAVKKRQNKN